MFRHVPSRCLARNDVPMGTPGRSRRFWKFALNAGRSSSCTFRNTLEPSISSSGVPSIAAAEGLAYSTVPVSSSSVMASELCSTRAVARCEACFGRRGTVQLPVTRTISLTVVTP